MRRLNFPTEYTFDLREIDGHREILDPLRHKYVRLTPEEWVRQHLVQYLTTEPVSYTHLTLPTKA